MEESRKQFQKWWEEFYETQPREPWSELYSPEHDYFVDQDIDGQYDAWKASRAAIEIELPSPDNYSDDEAVSAINDCKAAISAAGLKIKGE